MAITPRYTDGYQTGNPTAIARRYSSGAALASNLDQIKLASYAGFGPPRLPMAPAPAPAGAAGPSGAADTSTPLAETPVTGGDDQTMRNAAAFQDSPDTGVVPPAGNATQRWQNSTTRFYDRMASGSQRGANRVQSLMARRIYAGRADVPTVTGANNLRGSSDPNSPAPVQFNNSPSGWEAY